MMRIKSAKLLTILLLVVAVSLMLSTVSPVQAAGVRDPILKVHLTSPTITTPSDIAVVRLSAMPLGTSFNGFDLIVKTDIAVLSPSRIILGSALTSPIVITYCINGSGINCGINDGPGIAHLAARSTTNGVNGTLFKVLYKTINGVGSFGTQGTTVTLPCFSVTKNGVEVPSVNFSVISTTYGNVPASAQPTATIAANQTSIAIKSPSSHNVTIKVKGINGFSSLVTLSASTIGPLTARVGSTATTTVVSCDCGAQPALQLTIHPTAGGTFSVTVSEKIRSTIISSITITVTAS